MPSLPRRPTHAEHQAAVSRRLELLRAELAGSPGPPAYAGAVGAVEDDPWWSSATRVPQARLRVVPPRPGTDGHSVPVEGPAPWVPVPGRHASRREPERAGWLPEPLRGRVALGSTQLTVVAVLVAAGLAVTAWTVVRASPEPVARAAAPVPVAAAGEQLVELPAAGSSGVPGATPVGAVAPAPVPEAGGSLTVDVAGRVRRPGIAVLAPGSRVVDALEAAGGARGGVALTSLNLARLLVDGEQILVGVPLPSGAAASVLAPGGAAAPGVGAGVPGGLVNLNTATEADLDTLPDVGPVTAASILAWRAENGGFSTVDELLEVDGIGEATLTRLAPLVTV